jgi:dihydropteroate synthase
MHIKFLNNFDLNTYLKKINVEPSALEILENKACFKTIYLKDIKTSWANIIKQEMLSCGGDAAISKNSYNCKSKLTDILLMGTDSNFKKFISKMSMQPSCFNKLTKDIEKLFLNNKKITIKDKTYNLEKDFLIMGVLNLTPDSFSDGGKFNSYDMAMKRVESFIKDGANVIDVGGESTRPSAKKIDSNEELDRIYKVIEGIKKNFNVFVSVDTYKTKVIKEVLKLGVDLINDVSGGKGIKENIKDIIKNNVSAIAMMNKGKSITGSRAIKDLKNPEQAFYDFYEKTKKDFLSLGLNEDKIIFDPGIGFGLSKNDISKIIKNAKTFNFPTCFGLSRKSYLSTISDVEVLERDNLSNSISLYLMLEGVRMFRTHDVKGLINTIKFYKTLEKV